MPKSLLPRSLSKEISPYFGGPISGESSDCDWARHHLKCSCPKQRFRARKRPHSRVIVIPGAEYFVLGGDSPTRSGGEREVERRSQRSLGLASHVSTF